MSETVLAEADKKRIEEEEKYRAKIREGLKEPKKRKSVGCGTICLVLVILFVVIGVTSVYFSPYYTPPGQSSTEEGRSEPVYLLELESFKVFGEYGFAHITGRVKNISDKPLKNVEAVGQFFDAQGGFIKEASALVEYNPILPGQVSPFEVLTTSNPAIEKGSVSFKYLLGGTIPTEKKGE